MFDLAIPLPLDADNPEPNVAEQSDRAHWTWAVSMHKLLEADPDRFFAEPVKGERTCPGLADEQKEPLHNGHSAEDWSRAYHLLKGRIRFQSRKVTLRHTLESQKPDESEPPELSDYAETEKEQEDVAAIDAPSDSVPSFPRNPFHKRSKPLSGISYHRTSNHNLALLSPWAFQLRRVMASEV